MSLLIKGMDMLNGSSNLVKTAYTCDLVISKDGKHELVERGARYSCYEISTPHGRLIDADEAIEYIKSLYCDNCGDDCDACIYSTFINYINDRPTVIEAEDGE